ncbi:uncharacterized protein LOC124720079 isoform X2 [Schistocerca piceifrons]|uniref:uncharacterized protein LOC124720079 isoform X2 n=1 Tax=Schistocerca piceifrons TaxID=274613 RepID=UPI001F5EB9F5|nr:uncharacterized protein LOC124720079 isoform X2 [Schistocerca piceifrons]
MDAWWLRRAIMDCKGTSWVKKEKNEIYAEPESLFLEDPLKIVTPSLHIKQDLELKQEDGIEHDVCKLKSGDSPFYLPHYVTRSHQRLSHKVITAVHNVKSAVPQSADMPGGHLFSTECVKI